MNKKGKYALTGAAILGIGNAILNAINQLDRIESEPNKSFDWGELLGAAAKGALVGGAGGLAIGAIADYRNSLQKPVNTDAFLFSVVDTVRLRKSDREYKTLDEKAAKLAELLKIEFGDKLAGEPMRLGSTESGTALADDFDIDICLPFKPGSFSSTGEMYDCVNDCLVRLIGKQSIIETRDQKKSIGVIVEIRGERRRIDVVPYKLTAKRGNKSSGYLYVNDNDNPSYTKTDIKALKSLNLTETQKKIVVVLKHWKKKYGVPLSSHLLQNFVIDAYKRNYVPKKFTQKVIMVLEHIRDNMSIAVIRSVENSNNVLTDISDRKKSEIVSACKKVLEEYEYQPNSLVELF